MCECARNICNVGSVATCESEYNKCGCVYKKDIFFKRTNQTIFMFNMFFPVCTVYLNPQATLFIYVEIFE